MIWCLLIIGTLPIVGMTVDHNHDALYTMIGHIAIFGGIVLNYKQSRANGAKMDAAKVALGKKDSG